MNNNLDNLVGDRKCAQGMRESLCKLFELLKCPLCNKIFDKPTTLSSCAHSFCVSCIDSYCCGSWVCPVEGCGMPMSIVGGHKGSYRKINPQLSQTVESLKTICNNLNRAPDYWWKSDSVMDIVGSSLQDSSYNAGDGINIIHNNNTSNNNEEEMIDLQKDEMPFGTSLVNVDK